MNALDTYRAGFAARVAQDAFHEATATYWRRRAHALEQAMPRAGEYHGRATPAELKERAARLREEVQACRNRARVAQLGGDPW